MPMGWTSCSSRGRLAERVVRREAPLVHARRGERREADDVADGEDVRHSVRYCSSTAIRPRGSAVKPAAVRSSSSVCPCRPGGVHDGVGRDPLAGRQPCDGPVPCRCRPPPTSSPNRNVTDRSRRWNFSDSTTSGSQNSSIAVALLDDGDACARARRTSTRTRCRSSRRRRRPWCRAPAPAPRTPSESTTRASSNSHVGGRCRLGAAWR